MTGLRFVVSDLHPETPDLSTDLDWLLRFVAGSFEIHVHGARMMGEIDFPVLDLARALHAWLATDFATPLTFDYEVPGGSPRTLSIAPRAEGWEVDSALRPVESPAPRPLNDLEVIAGVRAFMAETAIEVFLAHGYHVLALLRRSAKHAGPGPTASTPVPSELEETPPFGLALNSPEVSLVRARVPEFESRLLEVLEDEEGEMGSFQAMSVFAQWVLDRLRESPHDDAVRRSFQVVEDLVLDRRRRLGDELAAEFIEATWNHPAALAVMGPRTRERAQPSS